jgi:heterodisulfide reductase subunit C
MFLGGGLANGIGGNVTIGTEVNSQKKLTTSKQAGACFKCGQCPGGIVVV